MWDPVVQATRTIEKDTANQSVKSLAEHMVIVPNLMSAVVSQDLVGINAKMLDVQVRFFFKVHHKSGEYRAVSKMANSKKMITQV